MAQAKPIRLLKVGLGETTRDYIASNDAAQKFAGVRDGGSAFYEVYYDDPAWDGLQLQYRSGACSYDFPPGRWLEVGQMAGRITVLTLFMPTTTLGFGESVALAQQIRSGLNGAGWTETRWLDAPDPKDINSNPFAPGRLYLASWNVCGNASQTASLSIKNAAPDVVGTSVPLDAQVRRDPVRPGGEFLLLLEVTVSRQEDMALVNLAAARRLAVNGDPEKELPAQVRIDAPDWQPQK